MKYLSVSIGLPFPTRISHQPGFFVIGLIAQAYWSPVSACQISTAFVLSLLSFPYVSYAISSGEIDFPEAKLKSLVVYLTVFVISFYWFIVFTLTHRNFNNSLILE